MQSNPAETASGDAKEKPGPRFLIGIRIKGRDKSELFDPTNLKLRVGNKVVVPADKGTSIGFVASNKIPGFNHLA